MGHGAGRRRRPSGSTSKSHKRRKKMSLEKRIQLVIDKNAEMKYLDSAISDTNITAAGVEFGSMAIVTQGININQRIGKEIRIKKIMARFNVILNETTAVAESYDVCRIMMLHVREHADVSSGIVARVLSTPATIYSFNNLLTSSGITTLWDKFIQMHSTAAFTATVAGPTSTYVEWFKDVNISLVYSSTTGALTENEVSSIQLIALSQRGDINLLGTVRIRYQDM